MRHFDIVIVGGGTAGMTCAIEAAERGASVGVIEKDNKIGGAMHWSGGHMSAAGNRHQVRNNVKDSIDEHYADIIRINGGSGDLNLIRKAVEEAPLTLDWLDDQDFDWAPECPRIIYGHVPYTTSRTQYGIRKAISILETIRPKWEAQVEAGRITCFLNTEFVDVDQENDRYNIVKCISDGVELIVKGDHIVMTTGGYGSNRKFFGDKHGDIPFNSSAYPNSTAEGMIIMEDLGADFRMADYHLPSLGGMELEPGSGRSNFNEAWAMVITSVYRQPRDIYVNSDGLRFMAEDEVNADTREREVIKQKDWCFWVVFDEAGLQYRDESGIENPIVIGWNTAQIKAEAQKQKAIFSANSIDELAVLAGLPSDNLKSTVKGWNDIVDNQEDPIYQRKYLSHKIEQGPYYAIKVHASLLVTFGGIKVNPDLQIVNKTGDVFPGLYGAGEFLGLGALSGDAFCSGMAITPALSFGRILGQEFTK